VSLAKDTLRAALVVVAMAQAARLIGSLESLVTAWLEPAQVAPAYDPGPSITLD